MLSLLDMSAAFDCVDHSILLQRLERNFGISGLALQWLTSFLTHRTQQVTFNGTLCKLQRLLYGVPQGSVLGRYCLICTWQNTIVESHGHRLHQYADDCQVYVSAPVTETAAAVDQFLLCIADVSTRLSSSRLRLNPAKTVVIWLGGRQQVANITVSNIPVLSSTVTTVTSARDLGVVVNSQLSMSANVSSRHTCRSAYHQLCQLRPVVRSLSADAAKTAVQSFVSTRLDYCNSLMYGIADGLMQRHQAVQNAAARLITGARRRDHISPVLRQLHWFPVRQRVQFKLAVLVFKVMHRQAHSA